MTDCLFCKIGKKEIPSEFVYENDNFFAILDIHPKSEGHTLIIPKNHYNNFMDMPNTMAIELSEAIKEVFLNLVKQGKAQGFNIIINNGEIAGQVVNHLHVHIIPRKKDD